MTTQGKLTNIEKNAITVNMSGYDQVYRIIDNVNIRRNSMNTSINNLEINDLVTFDLDSNSQITSITALSDKIASFSMYLVPSLILLAVSTIFLIIERTIVVYHKSTILKLR
ncbi:MAG: hypothetical protein AAGF07_03345 [Patescibacteria group bacterium]